MRKCEKCSKDIVPPERVDLYRAPYTKNTMNLCVQCAEAMHKASASREPFVGVTNETLPR